MDAKQEETKEKKETFEEAKRDDKYDDTEDEEDEDFVPEKENDDKDEDNEEDAFDESADNEGIKKPKKKEAEAKPEEKKEEEEKKKDAQSLYAKLKASCAVKKAPEEKKAAGEAADKNKKVTVTTVYDFAGEKVAVTKEVAASASGPASNAPKPAGQKRAAAGGGGLLSSILGPKPKKMSTLDKSKLDWQKYKTTTGISESLSNIKKSNDSFLEKKAFLNRTEQRQYEIERELRLSKKK